MASEPIVLTCPQCGSDDVGSADVLLATALGSWSVDADGEFEFLPVGETKVWWDTQEPQAEQPCICEACSWRGKPSEMGVPVADER